MIMKNQSMETMHFLFALAKELNVVTVSEFKTLIATYVCMRKIMSSL